MNKKKVAFWVIMILANAIIGVISVRTYQSLEARVSNFETNQKNYYRAYAEMWKVLGLDSNYDFNNILVKEQDLDDFLNYKVYVRTTVVLRIPDLRELSSVPAQSVTKVNEAPAIIISRYVLMTSHVSDAELFSKQTIRLMTPNGALGITIVLKVLKYNIALLAPDGAKYSLKELYRNREKDFALFEIQGNVSPDGTVGVNVPNFPFEIGKSNELKIGHFVYLNGRPKINSEVARLGYVTSLASTSLDDALKVKKDDNEFGISQSTDQGDSGSPIMAFRDGRQELVGIYLGWVGKTDDNGKNTRSRALKINIAVDEIKAKVGIDLRELQRQILYK